MDEPTRDPEVVGQPPAPVSAWARIGQFVHDHPGVVVSGLLVTAALYVAGTVFEASVQRAIPDSFLGVVTGLWFVLGILVALAAWLAPSQWTVAIFALWTAISLGGSVVYLKFTQPAPAVSQSTASPATTAITEPPWRTGSLKSRALALAAALRSFAAQRTHETPWYSPPLEPAPAEENHGRFEAFRLAMTRHTAETMSLYADHYSSDAVVILNEFAALGITPVGPEGIVLATEFGRPTNPLSISAVADALSAMAARLHD